MDYTDLKYLMPINNPCLILSSKLRYPGIVELAQCNRWYQLALDKACHGSATVTTLEPLVSDPIKFCRWHIQLYFSSWSLPERFRRGSLVAWAWCEQSWFLPVLDALAKWRIWDCHHWHRPETIWRCWALYRWFMFVRWDDCGFHSKMEQW